MRYLWQHCSQIRHIKQTSSYVDWSYLDTSKRNFLIRAAVALDGRNITIYQEVHPLNIKEKPATHLAFLAKLKQMLPIECKLIIITDAGFKTP